MASSSVLEKVPVAEEEADEEDDEAEEEEEEEEGEEEEGGKIPKDGNEGAAIRSHNQPKKANSCFPEEQSASYSALRATSSHLERIGRDHVERSAVFKSAGSTRLMTERRMRSTRRSMRGLP